MFSIPGCTWRRSTLLSFTASFILFYCCHGATKKEKFCSKYKCEKTQGNVIIGHFSGNFILDRFLNDTEQKKFSAINKTICVKTCVKDDPCRTISVVPDANSTNVTCFLSGNNIYNTKPVYLKGSKIIMLGTPACDSSPCMEGSQCQPDYDSGHYSCSDLRPDVYLSFNKTVEPECKDGTLCMDVATNNAKIVKLYDAKTPVLMTDNLASHFGVKYLPKGMEYFRNPLVSPRNLTFTLWTKNSGEFAGNIFLINMLYSWNINIKDQSYALVIAHSGNGFTEMVCDTRIPLHAFNSWNHLAVRVTKDIVTMSVNGKICVREDISSLSHHGATITEFVVSYKQFPAVVAHFIDSISVFNDYKSDQFIKELYEREKKNFVRSRGWVPVGVDEKVTTTRPPKITPP